MCVSLYFLCFFFCVTTEFLWSSLFTRQTGNWIDTSSDPSVILLNFCVKTGEFEVKIFAHVSGFEYPLSLLPVCYHGTGRIILASTVTSRAQACQITVTGGLPLHIAISSSRKHLFFSLWPLYSSTRLNYCLFTWIFH
jgi:hypothetical protein